MVEPDAFSPFAAAPLVSVVMAAYNEAQHVRAAVESICGQSWQAWELIVVDDASTDDTWQILNELAAAEPRIRLLRNARNWGAPASWNRALACAHGELIARMDADDISRLDRLETQVRFLLAHPQVDVVGGGAIEIDEQGNVLGEVFRRESHAEMAAFKYKECPFIHPSVLGRARFWQTLGGYDATLLRSQDYDLWLRGFDHYRYHNLMTPLIWYRRRPLTSRSSRYMAYTIWKNIRREGKVLTHGWYAARPMIGYWVWKWQHR